MAITSALSVLFLSACAPPDETSGVVADAGPYRRGTIEDLYFFDASDSEGEGLTYSWQFVEKPINTQLTDDDIENWNTPYPVLEPDVVGDYELEVTVCDDMGNCDRDIAVAFVMPIDAHSGAAPTASCSFDAAITTLSSTTMDCSASSDPESDPLTYRFSFYSKPGSSALADWQITDRYTDTASFTPDVDGSWSVRFRVIDDTPNSDRIFLEMTSTGGGNTAPVSDAGGDQSVALGPTVSLDGTGSYDDDGDSLSYRWTFKTLPAKSSLKNAHITGRYTDSASFPPDVEGTYEMRLRVDDGTTTAVDFATITVSGSPSAGDLAAGDLVITEIMKNPAGSDSAGEWIEIYNNAGFDVDLSGLTLEDDGGNSETLGSYTIGDGDYAVIGSNTDSGTNGGVGVDLGITWSNFKLDNAGDEVVIKNGATEVDRVNYGSGTYPNVSGDNWNLDRSVRDATSNDSSANWCRGYDTYGTSGNYGTPGWYNNDCLDSSDVQAIVDSECSGCHTGGGSSGNLSMDTVYTDTVNVASDDVPKMDLIEPSDTANSYLWHKVNGTHGDVGGAGDTMPQGGSLSAGDLATIEDWINGGAVE